MTNEIFHWTWLRRTIDANFDKLLLVALIGISVALAALGDILAVVGHWSFARNWVSREWLREETALLIGALLGLMRGESSREGEKQNGKEILADRGEGH